MAFVKRFSCFLLMLMLTGCSGIFTEYEEPSYNVIKRFDHAKHIEHRRYDPYLVAEVKVSGNRDEAAKKGFRQLADFIFGNNQQSVEMDMTIPVTQQPVSEQIEMTAPVKQEQLSDNSWRIQFVMPSKYSKATLPKPVNDAITVKELPGYEAVAIRFSGRWQEENFNSHKAMLEEVIKEQGLKPIGSATYAYYNAPFTLWFMRRNEIIYRLAR